MRRGGQGAVTLLVGGMMLRLVLGGGFQSYVKGGMRIPLVLAGGLLVLVGASTLWRDERDNEAHPDDHGAPRVAWLLLAPLAALVLVSPAPLGAFAAGLQSGGIPERLESTAVFPPLTTERPAPLKVSDFVARAIYDDSRSIEGVPVRLVGFVSMPKGAPGDFALTRFVISCCAADGVPVHVALQAPGQRFAVDTWVEVEGQWVPPQGNQRDAKWVVLEATSIRRVEEPSAPYEGL